MKTLRNAVKASYLCIRFPFLYPRNRFTGRHYNNWILPSVRKEVYDKWFEYSKTHQKEYYEKFGKDAINMYGEPIQVYTDEVLKRSHIHSEYVMGVATLKDRLTYWWCGFAEEFLSIFHFIPTHTELDMMPSGWRKRLGLDLCRELKTALLKSGRKYLYEFRIMDIKQCGGGMWISAYGVTSDVERVLQKYEYISNYVCIDCGEDATKFAEGYYDTPYCEKCIGEPLSWRWIDPIYGYTNPDKVKYNRRNEEGL